MTELESAMAHNRGAVEDFIARAREVDVSGWTVPRAEGAWSPAQIVEHLALTYEFNRAMVMGNSNVTGFPRFLRPLVRRLVVDSTLKAGRFTRKGRSPAIFRPSATPAPQADLIARLRAAMASFEAGIRSSHPEGRRTINHPYFGAVPMINYLELQAIHTRHHRAQLPGRASQQ
jgi:hypothetical protein